MAMGSTWWDRFCSWVLSWWPLVWRSDHERECQQLTDELHVCNALFTTRGVLTHKHLKAALARLRDSLPANVAWSDVSDSLAAVGLAPLERLLEAETKITALVDGASCAGLCPLDWYASRAMVVEDPAMCTRVVGAPCGKDKIESCWREFARLWAVSACGQGVKR